jgi:nitrogen fixation NifU-like protein
LLAESVVGKTLEEVKALSKDDILAMLGIELGPVRLKCALLSLKVLKAGVYGVEEVEEELR